MIMIFVSLSIAPFSMPDGPLRDYVALQGTWRLVEFNSKKPEREGVVVFAGTRVTLSKDDPALPFVIDPTKSPKWLTFWYDKDSSSPALYKLEGDKLTIVLASEWTGHVKPPPRPTSLDPRGPHPEGLKGVQILVLDRANR